MNDERKLWLSLLKLSPFYLFENSRKRSSIKGAKFPAFDVARFGEIKALQNVNKQTNKQIPFR